jgi:hypothetical protein
MPRITCFYDLLKSYSHGEALFPYLESEEGGSFHVSDDTEGLRLIRYEKGASSMELPHSRWCRSVVWDTTHHLPVCIAPPKASDEPLPWTTVEDMLQGGVCQERLDGVMINCFRIAGDNTLHIATRSKLNAAGCFYSSKSFSRLFTEAYVGQHTESDEHATFLLQQHADGLLAPDPAKNEHSTFYSFLVQHTEHRIVYPVEENRVFLIHRGVVYQDGQVNLEDSEMPSITLTPEGDTLLSSIHAYCSTQPWYFHGIVLKDKEGRRWRFVSEKYAAVKSLRGNSPSTVERYAQLYTQNLISTYLEYYPEDAFAFSFHRSTVYRLCAILYDLYGRLHIAKSVNVTEINKMYLPHLYSLHGIYLSQLRPTRQKLAVTTIVDYMGKLPWQRVVFLIKKQEGMYFSELRDMFQSDPMNGVFDQVGL